MSRPSFKVGALVFVSCLLGAQAATAKYLHSYAVKFVCGYNDSNVGYAKEDLSTRAGEPSVKLGNYATEINIVNNDPNSSPETTDPLVRALIGKTVLVLVEGGKAVGREPRVVGKRATDNIELGPMEATMDDCNRIAELIWGTVPTPFPLTIGYLMIASTAELDVNAVYTAQVCSLFGKDGKNLPCLDSEGKPHAVSLSIDVERVIGRKFGQ